MTEQELLHEIKESAEDLEIPEGIAPKQVQETLRGQKKPGRYPWRPLAVAAAALVLVTGFVTLRLQEPGKAGGSTAESGAEGAPESASVGQEESPMQRRQRKDAGDWFTVAKDYDQVYAMIERMAEDSRREFATNTVDGIALDGALKAESNMAGSAPSETPSSDSSEQMSGHSETNVQMEGVDESDIIKTDGDYIYTVRQGEVAILDIRQPDMQLSSRISVEGADAYVEEMYVEGDMLNLIVQRQDASLTSQGEGASQKEEGTVGMAIVQAIADKVFPSTRDVLYMDDNTVTHLLTYDISNREEPKLVGDMAQDGIYYTSRKIGDIVYLFTNQYQMGEIPSINGEQVPFDCIYLPQQGSQGLLASSVDVTKPDQTLDQVMIVNQYVQVYVSTSAMYLHQYSWDGWGATKIAKFSLNQGMIDAVDAVSVRGEIRDAFAINEGNGQLRVLTTDRSGERDVNNLYVLDEGLRQLGSLEGLAPGEVIYSARFLGDMAYFVTYRNMDPLFAVDLSDPANPKVLSELKITGFSEYLHFWGEGQLLGIGYETDPDTGRNLGLKLSMFQIADAANVHVQDSIVLRDLTYSPALYEYKTVLADPDANLFGFVGEGDGEAGWENSYYLYRWGENGFERLLKQELDIDIGESQFRGLYSGARFYLACPDTVASYDREKEYQQIGSFIY